MHRRVLLAAALLGAGPALAQSPSGRTHIDAMIEREAAAAKVPAAFVHRVVKRESNYNPNAKGGSALGLMQIKHATARGMGYSGDATGLYDPLTNLRYGIAYLAGAYRAAQGDLDQAYRYYSRGYYHAAKRLGFTTSVAELEPAPVPAAAKSASSFGSLFSAAPVPATAALAYAPAASAPVDVPLPPRRPDAPVATAGAPAPQSPAPAPIQVAATSLTQAAETTPGAVEVPLPPRRPAMSLLAAVPKPTARTAAPVQEASALPATP